MLQTIPNIMFATSQRYLAKTGVKLEGENKYCCSCCFHINGVKAPQTYYLPNQLAQRWKDLTLYLPALLLHCCSKVAVAIFPLTATSCFAETADILAQNGTSTVATSFFRLALFPLVPHIICGLLLSLWGDSQEALKTENQHHLYQAWFFSKNLLKWWEFNPCL